MADRVRRARDPDRVGEDPVGRRRRCGKHTGSAVRVPPVLRRVGPDGRVARSPRAIRRDGFGATSAISADGTTILAGDQQGHHLYPFTYSAGHWTSAATVRYGPLVGFIALTADGSRAVVSDYSTHGGTAARVYQRNGAHWRAIAVCAGRARARSWISGRDHCRR